ncbi:S8 family peptidase [Acinetobacter ursingii]|uniref:S8 family peptidase n=1 Tax=Acinetobacter ursingii TaxID=108980 RepID=UPI0005CA1C96|nr:S8 family peptidase [Acinetobacter ursingii]
MKRILRCLPLALIGLLAHTTHATSPAQVTYLIKFNTPVTDRLLNSINFNQQFQGKIKFIYQHAFQGVAVQITQNVEQEFVRILKLNPTISLIEKDQVFKSNATTQTNATWGLDRSDQHNLPLNSTYNADGNAQGVPVYVVDTGVLASHQDFAGRVKAGYTAVSDGNGTTDCNGHGTHVAGTIAGTKYGIAKSASIIPVRVLDCNGSGTTSTVIAGLDWVASQNPRNAVVNLSLGGGTSTALDDAINQVVNKDIVVVVAAGNNNADACNYSPSRVPAAITVGATTNQDQRANYSNYGKCLDIFAPGSNITSDWYSSNTATATATASGTSMASPHVAGLAAILRAIYTGENVSQITNRILNKATTNKVTDSQTGSPNRLLYTRL